jgi:N-acetylmuramate 1-kinase
MSERNAKSNSRARRNSAKRASMDDVSRARAVADLVESGFGAGARVVTLAPLAGDASSRRYFRARLAGAPAPTAVVMEQTGSGLSISSDELAVFDETPKELPFLNVQRYLRAVGAAVPEIHAVDAERGLVLLEDIGDRTLWDAALGATRDERLRLYRAAIDEMILMQAAGARQPDPKCRAFRQRFDARLFLWEFDHFLEYGFVGRTLAEGERRALREQFEELAEDLAAGELVLTHRDFHSWNLFLHEDRIRVIDFQDALLAPLPYDLATLLNDRATPAVTGDVERDLVRYFLERSGRETEFTQLFTRYALFVFQKSAKVVGRFVYLEDVKGKRGYRAMIPDTLATMRRSLERLPRLAELRARLARSFPELA